ncbi:MAG TPA: protein kinase [Planctomycetota bacterium]|nr:protein kinase [Planctomycetota bacterium]
MTPTTTPEPALCPRCQGPLPANGAPCPRCLLHLALEPTAATLPTSAAGTPSIAELQPLLPAYELQTLLGRGGMAAVYRARHIALDRLVAIKVLLPDLVRDPAFAERFEREARALARLDHRGIVGIHDLGRAGEWFYLAMEYVDGANLRELLAQGQLTARDVLSFVPQLCDALQYAHDHRVVHRDIKPENILVDHDGRVHIADFGLAKLLGQDTQDLALTRTHQAVGTPHYMAPEQIGAPGNVDHRADLYSLGVVLYEMLTGVLPIGRFSPPSAKAAEARPFDPVVMKSLENDRERRYQQAKELKTDVENTQSSGSGKEPGAKTSSRQGSHAPWTERPLSTTPNWAFWHAAVGSACLALLFSGNFFVAPVAYVTFVFIGSTVRVPAPIAEHWPGRKFPVWWIYLVSAFAMLVASGGEWARWVESSGRWISVNAWHAKLQGVPIWLVLIPAAVVTVLAAIRDMGGAVPHLVVILAALVGGGLSGSFAVVMANEPGAYIGPPAFITTAVFLCWILFDLVARARSRPRQRMATAKQRDAERHGRIG